MTVTCLMLSSPDRFISTYWGSQSPTTICKTRTMNITKVLSGSLRTQLKESPNSSGVTNSIILVNLNKLI